MGRSSSDSRPTIPPPFDVARFARDSDAKAVGPTSDEFEIDIDASFRSVSEIRISAPPAAPSLPPRFRPPPPRPPRPTPVSSYHPREVPGSASSPSSIEALAEFVDADPADDLLSSIEIEVAQAYELQEEPTSVRPSGPRSKGPPLSQEALRHVPMLARGGDVARLMSGLDPKTAFLISRFDGYSDLETVIDISGMSAAEAIDLLSWLVEQGIVVLS